MITAWTMLKKWKKRIFYIKLRCHYVLGCSLFIKNALYFTGIESCSCVTEIGLKILELMVFVIGKNAPRHTHLGGNPTITPNFFTIWENFLVFFKSNLISYRNMQEFIVFGYNISLWIYGVSPDFGVKMVSFVITPKVTTAGEFFRHCSPLFCTYFGSFE